MKRTAAAAALVFAAGASALSLEAVTLPEPKLKVTAVYPEPEPVTRNSYSYYSGDVDAASTPESVTPTAPKAEYRPKARGGDLWDDRAPEATYPVKMKQTLLPDRYTADASAHVVDGKVFAWTSHDIPVDTNATDETQYMMTDYALIGFSEDMGTVEDYGNVLPLETVPWADRMMWAPDAVCKTGMGCFLYFPAQDKDFVFKIGVAYSKTVYGPYTADPEPIQGSYSIDPAVFTDDDGQSYMVFGGDWGGQLQGYTTEIYDKDAPRPTSGDALKPRVAKMSADMKSFVGGVKRMDIVDAKGKLLQADDLERRFFEGAWIHKIGEKYYLSYSTGETHKLVYATSSSPTGPWTYQAEILAPCAGWTTHHSIVKATDDKWYLFYHDAKQSGKDNLRNVKIQELTMDGDKILPMTC